MGQADRGRQPPPWLHAPGRREIPPALTPPVPSVPPTGRLHGDRPDRRSPAEASPRHTGEFDPAGYDTASGFAADDPVAEFSGRRNGRAVGGQHDLGPAASGTTTATDPYQESAGPVFSQWPVATTPAAADEWAGARAMAPPPVSPGAQWPAARRLGAGARPGSPGGRGGRRFPRYRLLSLITVAVAFAAVAALGLPTINPPTPEPPPPATGEGRATDAAAGATAAVPPTPGGEAGGRPPAADPAADGSAATGGSSRTGTGPAQHHADLAVRDVDRLGPVVVDADGLTLYRYDGDAAGSGTCVDACTSTWIPVTVGGKARLSVDGIDRSAVGLVERSDGDLQLTVRGWPVYRFAGDSRPGSHTGHGLGSAWYAITPSGGKASGP